MARHRTRSLDRSVHRRPARVDAPLPHLVPDVRDIALLAVPALAYAGQAAFVYAAQGRWGMALCFLCYAIGNIGLMLDVKGI